MPRRRIVRVRAFAKINLSLRVTGVREDGYHELATVFQSVALFDTLTFTHRDGPFALTCDDPRCPADETNLIWRAALGAWRASRRSGLPRGLAVHLTKRIPMQAGLGGGSSDAAAALRVFGRLWGLSTLRVRELALGLGADVPYFLVGGTVLGLGRGDRLTPFRDTARQPVVIVVPPFGVSTKDAFAWWDRDRSRKQASGGNDLEAPVARRRPQISRLLAELRRAGAVEAAMSGSGSAVFGLFKTAAAATRAAHRMRGRGRVVKAVRMLTRAECEALAPK